MKVTQSITYSLLGLLLLVVSSYISLDLPWNGRVIPITAQSLAVLLIGYYLGAWRGALLIVIYIALGAYGLPVFADGRSGISIIAGNSGGYLLGFVLAAVYMGSQAGKLLGRFLPALVAMIGGTLWILLPGVLWLTWLHGLETAFVSGFLNVLPGAVVKAIIGAVIIVITYKSLRPLA